MPVKECSKGSEAAQERRIERGCWRHQGRIAQQEQDIEKIKKDLSDLWDGDDPRVKWRAGSAARLARAS